MKNVTPVMTSLQNVICLPYVSYLLTLHIVLLAVFIILSWPNCPAFFNSVGKGNTEELFFFLISQVVKVFWWVGHIIFQGPYANRDKEVKE